MYSELPVFFLCPQKKQLKNRLASPPSTLVQTLTDSVHFFFIKCLCQWWMYLFVWSCFQFVSVHFGWDDVFRVWVYSVVVNKKKCQDGSFSNLWRRRHEECISPWSVHHKGCIPHRFCNLISLKACMCSGSCVSCHGHLKAVCRF